MAILVLAVLVPEERLTVVQKHIVHGRERVVYPLYLVDVPVYAPMPVAFLRQGTSLSPQRGGLCEAHRIMTSKRSNKIMFPSGGTPVLAAAPLNWSSFGAEGSSFPGHIIGA